MTWRRERVCRSSGIRVRNLFRDAANRIHDDVVARQHGFAGALVAGVTIYGYLTRLPVLAWGSDWLRRGTASVRFLRPLYDGETLASGGRVAARSGNDSAGRASSRSRDAPRAVKWPSP